MYGTVPKNLGEIFVNCDETFHYQYLPIKLATGVECAIEERLMCFMPIISTACADFAANYGLERFKRSYVYITAKRLYQDRNLSFNRKGYHSDGFMTKDINYIWSDTHPTVFNCTKFNLTLDDKISMVEMEQQALEENELTYPDNSLLRLDQYNIHRVNEIARPCVRTFVKIFFSKDKYDLRGNSKNYLLNYNWEMRERRPERNIPQKLD